MLSVPRKCVVQHVTLQINNFTVYILQQEAVANVRKTKTLYITRQQEYEKAKETAQKAESESLNQSSTGQAAKVEKKKKLVEDALRKVCIQLSLFLVLL